jgi:hypothetical protein
LTEVPPNFIVTRRKEFVAMSRSPSTSSRPPKWFFRARKDA